MRPTQLPTALALALLFCLSSCGDDGVQPPQGNPDPPELTPVVGLLPGAVGNTWTYIDSTWAGNAVTRVVTWTCRIYGTEVLYGLRAWRVDNPPPLFPAFFIAGIDTTWTPSYVTMIGQTFRAAYVIGTRPPRLVRRNEGDYLAELLTDTVTVLAGRFTGCTSIRFDQRSGSRGFQETILKPGVGIVRAVCIGDTLNPGGCRESITLSEYTIVSGPR